MRNQNIAARVLNQPLLLEPGYARVFIGALAPRLGIASLRDEYGMVESEGKLRMRADAFDTDRPRNRPYEVVNGIAVIPVSGSLVHKFGHLQPYSGMTGYDGIIARVEDALGDPTVDGLLLDFDTPGGEVAGCFDTAQRLNQLRGVKPMAGISYDMACSAGMALFSGLDYRYTTSTARTGSVGVVMMHVSYEELLRAEGMEVTLIHSGALKVDGNPYENLPERVMTKFQADSDRIRNEFAEMVAGQIGLSVSDVLATEAAIYTGSDAIEHGFADELVNGHEIVAAFSDYVKTTKTTGVSTMSVPSNKPAADQQNPAPAANTQTTTTEPETTSLDSAQIAQRARADERARVSGILNCEEAEGRAQLAQHLAFKTSMSVDEAKTCLAASASETGQQGAGTSLLDAAMGNTSQPEIGADSQGHKDSGQDSDPATGLMADYRQAKGITAQPR